MTSDADGDFIVVWESYGQDGEGNGVFARQFSSAGDYLAIEFQINAYTIGFQYNPAVVADADGDFVVAWESSHPRDGYASGVFARRFSSSGTALASEFQVNTYTHSFQGYPSLAAHADGDVIAAWVSYTQDGSDNGIFARRFSSAGAPLAVEFQVHTHTTNGQGRPSVVIASDGGFVVVWNSVYQDGSNYGVFPSRFTSAGDPVGPELQVNTYTTGHQNSASIAKDDHGDFVVAWGGSRDYGSSNDTIFAQRFSSAGDRLAREFQVNTYTTNFQSGPSVAAGANGDFVIAWDSYRQDGSGGGVFAQRFSSVFADIDIDGNGSVEPLTDGRLILRFLFGFTGSTLIAGAVDVQAGEYDGGGGAGYLASIVTLLDADGDGERGPLTDGLLMLRFLFGFTGSTLTTGAVDTQNCTRCDAAAIEPYLQTLI